MSSTEHASTSTTHPTGRQHEIVQGSSRAIIVELGGGLRSFVAGGRELLDGFAEDEAVSSSRGQPLIPWPNRIDGGRYEWDGATHQLAITEPARGNASHGLLRFVRWEVAQPSHDTVMVSQLVLPQPGYPFTLAVQIEYRIDASDGGLVVTTTARNEGRVDLPFASGQHPYLAPPPGIALDDCTIQLAARTQVDTDERGIPAGRRPTAGTAHDLGAGAPLRGLQLDTAFTDLKRDDDGLAVARLLGPDGRGTELWVDATYPFVQLFTGDSLAPARRRGGIAVEPMTAPANAFCSGEHVTRLAPGAHAEMRWGLRPI